MSDEQQQVQELSEFIMKNFNDAFILIIQRLVAKLTKEWLQLLEDLSYTSVEKEAIAQVLSRNRCSVTALVKCVAVGLDNQDHIKIRLGKHFKGLQQVRDEWKADLIEQITTQLVFIQRSS